MNTTNLSHIFANYIAKFDFINDSTHQEYYKWQVCHEFPILMKAALEAPEDEFSKKLYEVKKCTYNIIDSYTQPFYGLVQCARENPEAVRKLFADLYKPDGNDLDIRMEKIEQFFNESEKLLKECGFGDSYLYAQNSHAVSSYLFLNDPDNHYMYKAVQSKDMSECIQFYDDWGYGNNIDLKKYHRMCDELVDEIKNNPELLATNESRFDGRLKLEGGSLHPDNEKHILLFDIIYCSNVYGLFDGVSYTKLNAKEKQLYNERKAKAQELKESFDSANKEIDELEEAISYFYKTLNVGTIVKHRTFGEGVIKHISEKYAVIEFSELEEEKVISIGSAVGLGLLTADIPGFSENAAPYNQVLLDENKIRGKLNILAKQLKEYEEYLD